MEQNNLEHNHNSNKEEKQTNKIPFIQLLINWIIVIKII